MNKPNVIVIVEGGVIQGVYTDEDLDSCVIVDYDTEGCSGDEPDIFKVGDNFVSLTEPIINWRNNLHIELKKAIHKFLAHEEGESE